MTDILYTIPSLAIFVILVTVTGISLLTVEIPLVLYTLVIFVRNIAAGFDSVPRDVLEAANGLGYTARQRLWRVEVPLAVPLILAGVRLATVSTIALVTVTSILGDGFGGLGFFILEGYRRSFPTELYFGAVPSIVLALLADFALARACSARLTPVAHRRGRRRKMDLLARRLAWLADPAHWSGPNGIPARLLEHVGLSAASLLIALAIALPVGPVDRPCAALHRLAVNSATLWRALPSLAVIAIVLPITAALDPQAGFKIYPTLVAMVVLAVPPILVNAQAGVAGVERDLVEAARGQGMSGRQVLSRVELPLAIPIIVAGIRSAAIQVVATATLGAIFGFGGLGRYLVEGFAQFGLGGNAQIVGGALLVASSSLPWKRPSRSRSTLSTPRGLRRKRSKTAVAA